MQYCTKCKSVCEDGVSACPVCKRVASLRKTQDDDLVFLAKTRGFEAEELAEQFDENVIAYELKPAKTGAMSSVYDSNYLPDDKNIYVKLIDLDRAKELIFKEENEQTEEEPMTDKKRLIVQVLSILAFLILVTLVTLGADWVANLIRDLFVLI